MVVLQENLGRGGGVALQKNVLVLAKPTDKHGEKESCDVSPLRRTTKSEYYPNTYGSYYGQYLARCGFTQFTHKLNISNGAQTVRKC